VNNSSVSYVPKLILKQGKDLRRIVYFIYPLEYSSLSFAYL
jgi:hypothetical protein